MAQGELGLRVLRTSDRTLHLGTGPAATCIDRGMQLSRLPSTMQLLGQCAHRSVTATDVTLSLALRIT